MQIEHIIGILTLIAHHSYVRILLHYYCTQELERFGKQCVDLHEEFLVSPCLDYDCTDKEAEPLITKYSTTVKGLKTIAQVLLYSTCCVCNCCNVYNRI